MHDAIRQVKEELVANARRAYEIGLQTGNGGNISGRVPGTDLIIIKASGHSFGETSPDNLVTISLQGEYVETNSSSASRELMTHLTIYRQRPDVYSIFHTHSPWAIAYASFGAAIPPVTFHAGAKLGHIPVLWVDSETTQAVADAVRDLLAAQPALQVFVQARHGIFSLAQTITLARQNAELVEETAQIAWLVALGNRLFANPGSGDL
ncbi:MAG: class II aldolase/adducin family protein [Chloroflexota bacterium]